MQIDSPPSTLHHSFFISWSKKFPSWVFLAAKPPASHADFFPKIYTASHSVGKKNAALPFPACSPKAECGREQFIITCAFKFLVFFSSHDCSCLCRGHCDKNQMHLNLSILSIAVWGEKQPCQLAALFRKENYPRLPKGFREWGLACDSSSVVFNC